MIRLDARERLENEERDYNFLTQAIGDSEGAQQARRLNGEDVPAYRARLASRLQHLSQYKNSDLLRLSRGDSTGFDIALSTIYADAAEHVRDTFTPGVLRGIEYREGEHKARKFVGDPMVWMAPFMGGAARFGRINRAPGPPLRPPPA